MTQLVNTPSNNPHSFNEDVERVRLVSSSSTILDKTTTRTATSDQAAAAADNSMMRRRSNTVSAHYSTTSSHDGPPYEYLQSSNSCATRKLMLKWTHVLLLVLVSVLVGVGLTMQFEQVQGRSRRDCAPGLAFAFGKETTKPPDAAVSFENDTFDTTLSALKLRVNGKIPETTENDGPWPKVAWLLSFPNSGTSFTSKMVRHYSQQSTASNYGEELVDATTGQSMPIYQDNTDNNINSSLSSSSGPFWIDPQTPGLNFTRPTIFALTKTHCGGRCEKCGPSKFVENTHSFLTQCLSGKVAHTTSNGQVVKKRVAPYDRKLVKRAVHLIRSPFDNVVSRFHLELHEAAKRNETSKLVKYPSSREGFRKFCIDLNGVYEREEASSRLFDDKVFELMKHVPCRDDFFRFVQWHNLAFVTTQSLKIPTLVVHYENYETKYNETVTDILEFLYLEPKGELIEFVKGKEYDDYFTLEERTKVKEAMELMALSSTWDQIAHYFN